jgi:DNA polymerase (family 10)
VSRNDEVARRLEEFADRLEATGVEYKPRAYRRAAENIREQPAAVETLAAEGEDAVQNIEGVGDAIASKVVEYVESGTIAELEALREDLPVDMAALTSVEGVGPKTVGSLYEALGIETLDDLEAAAEAGDIQTVSGFGAKTEQNILENIAFARQAAGRALLGETRPLADALLDHLDDCAAIANCEVAGSMRRWRPTVGDVDVLAASEEGSAVVEHLTDWERVTDVSQAGDTRASVRIDERQVDLRVVVPEEYGAALQYFTGSKDHNVRLRNYAIDRDLKLNEYGAFDVSEVADTDAGQRVGERVAGATETGMYEALGLPWIPPELREDNGEIDAAASGDLPDLVEPDALRGDLHTHTEWSDGDRSIAALADAAAEFGHDYLAITDHATGPGMVGGVGLDDDDLREQLAAIGDLADDTAIELFAGVETNIDADGGLSTGDDLLSELAIVVAAPHSALGQSGATATDRLVTAVEHPAVDVLGHPTGRLLGQRSGLAFDIDRVAQAAAENDVALEINSNPARLDCDGEQVRRAIDAGATIAVSTDAHRPAEFDHLRYGVHTARRGWATADDIVNTRAAAGVRTFLEK